MADPTVAEAKRFCSECQQPVGRSRNGTPGRDQGFCTKCRAPFSFAPRLERGELVAGQYEVFGCLAHGGLGWIYLARDRNVSDRFVVLKGLLNAGDADSYRAAVAERQFLAEVEHPLIVKIYNFVNHDGASYIVMEYVGGQSLKTLLKERMAANAGRYDPIPLDQALAYVIEILPAFAFLHSHGLFYCDFKPDNLIQQGDALKLIDLGGVRRADDDETAIYGTVGYQAPEVPEVGPSVASDIYTIGRTLAVMTFELRGNQSSYLHDLPPVESVTLFQEHDSFYRLLLKATAPSCDDRFQSADELREQLVGVLREVIAAQSNRAAAAHSTSSTLFEAPAVPGVTLTGADLPALKVDPDDPMADWLAGVSVPDPELRLAALGRAAERTREVQLGLIGATVELGPGAAPQLEQLAGELLESDPWEWRVLWFQGLMALARSDTGAAVAAFNAVYGQVPGEIAPKLALALACELDGLPEAAEVMYASCARTDTNYTAPAAFGLARLRSGSGDTRGAIDALDLIAPTSRAYVDARLLRADLLSRSDEGLPALAEAITSVAPVSIDDRQRQRLLIAVLDAAIANVRRNGEQPDMSIGTTRCVERDLRVAAERAYRLLAAMTEERSERFRLVDAANVVRPRTAW
jgi:serine/threonine-protein kinase PknG